MSLIQEALRRKDEESSAGPDRIPPRVVLPTGDAPSVAKTSERNEVPRGRAPIWDVVVVLLAVGLLAALVALGWFFYKFTPFLQSATAPVTAPVASPGRERKEPPSQTRSPATIADEVLPAAPSGAEGVPAAAGPEASAEGPALASAPKPKEAVPSEVSAAPPTRAPSSPVVPNAPPSGKATVTAAEGAGIEKRVGHETSPAEKEIKMVPVVMATRTSAWPRLMLNGVMAQAGPGQGSAIINGTVVEIGEKIDGARLLEVQRNGVLLEFRGQTQFVRVGQSTY